MEDERRDSNDRSSGSSDEVLDVIGYAKQEDLFNKWRHEQLLIFKRLITVKI